MHTGGGYSYGGYGSGSYSSRDGSLGRTACTSVVRELAARPSSWQYDDLFVSVLPPRIRALKPPAKARLPVAVQVSDRLYSSKVALQQCRVADSAANMSSSR